MKLTDLKPEWLVYGPNSDGETWKRGIAHDCPNTGKRHAVVFRPTIGPTPIRADSAQGMDFPIVPGQPTWDRVSGETFETLTLAPSIQRPCCHFTIVNGEIA